MKYLVMISGETEVYYELSEINKISYDYAKNIFNNEADLRENVLKPFDMVTVVNFTDGTIRIFSTLGWEMYFD